MTGPYGITQVDVPGLLGAYQNQQTNRVQQMMMTRQLEAMERQADRELSEQDTIARLTGRGGQQGGATAAYGSPGDVVGQSMSQGSGGMIGTPAPEQGPAARMRLDPQQLMELRLAGPRGTQVADAYEGMSTAERAATERRATTGLRVARSLLNLPQEQVMPAFQAAIPELVQNGFTEQELQAIAQNGLTREELQGLVQRGLPYLPASYRTVDGEVIDERLLGTGEDPRVYASEYVPTTEGLATRPGGRNFGGAGPQTRQARNRQTGQIETLQQDPRTGEWRPVPAPRPAATQTGSADLDNWNNAGRAGPSGPRTFR